MSLPIGIDLGTSTSEIAVFRKDRPEVIRNIPGSTHGVLPSAIARGPNGDLIVGEEAARSLKAIREAKKEIGSDERFQLGDESLRAEEVLARVVRHLKDHAEEVLAERITEAVITVPAAWTDVQRTATMNAGELAGLKVERLVNEPTAAALAYGIDQLDQDQTVLVFDLGGGTFDVSVLEMMHGLFETRATGGDRDFGGSNFDRILAEYIIGEMIHEGALPDGSLSDNSVMAMAIQEAKRAKEALSSQESVVIEALRVPQLQKYDFQTVLSRREFEHMTRDLRNRFTPILRDVLNEAGLEKDEVDIILLVGGSTRMPSVRQAVRDYFGRAELPERVPPDEAVALGAAIQAALRSSTPGGAGGMVATDVTSHSLGVSAVQRVGGLLMGQQMSVIVPRNTTYPVEREHRYATVTDGQDTVKIEVWQGENQSVQDNDPLGEFLLDGIPPAPAGEESVKVTFSIDRNMRLRVTAEALSTGRARSIDVEPSSLRMSDQEMEGARERLELDWKQSKLLKKVEPILKAAERRLPELDASDHQRVESVVRELKAALAAEDEVGVDELEEELTDILFNLE